MIHCKSVHANLLSLYKNNSAKIVLAKKRNTIYLYIHKQCSRDYGNNTYTYREFSRIFFDDRHHVDPPSTNEENDP